MPAERGDCLRVTPQKAASLTIDPERERLTLAARRNPPGVKRRAQPTTLAAC